MIGILLWLNILCWLLGFILPVPSFVAAVVMWFKTTDRSDVQPWRRLISKTALAALTAGIAFWAYVAVLQYRGADFYGTTTSAIGAGGAALLIIPSAFADKRIRLWPILGAIGLLLFFGISTGEAAI